VQLLTLVISSDSGKCLAIALGIRPGQVVFLTAEPHRFGWKSGGGGITLARVAFSARRR